jgi:hypothetical protein
VSGSIIIIILFGFGSRAFALSLVVASSVEAEVSTVAGSSCLDTEGYELGKGMVGHVNYVK